MSDMSYPTKENTKFMIVQGGEKKVMKKILSVALSTAMAFSMFASVAFGETATSADAQFTALAAKGIVSGFPDGQAHLEKDLTRAEFAKIVANLFDLDTTATTTTFKDKNYSTHWAKGFIEAVNKSGLMTGRSATTFDPSGKITVQEIATVLARALKLEVPTTGVDNNAATWAKGYVQAVINKGLMAKELTYTSTATRAVAIGAAYAIDMDQSKPAIASTEALNATTVLVTFADKSTATVTLTTALVENVATPFTFTNKGFSYSSTVTLQSAKVVSVTTPAGTKFLVTYNKVLNEASAETAANYQLNGSAIPGSPTFELQADKKSVLITMPVLNKLTNNTAYLFAVKDVLTIEGKTVPTFSTALTFADTTAPTLGAVSYTSNTQAKVSFSEGMTALAGTAVKVYDGTTDVTAAGLQSVNGIAANGDTDILVDLTNAEVNKTYTVKVFGALDLYGNFAGTQTFTVVRTNADVVKPVVESVTAVSLNTFKINFSEKVITDATTPANGYGDFTVGGYTGKLIAGGGVTSVTRSTDGKTLTVVLAAPATAGLNAVSVNNFFDASANKQTTAFVKVVNFAVDTTAPAVTKTEVIGDFLYVTFDDTDVTLNAVANALTSVKRVDNNVEYAVTSFGTAAVYDADGDLKTDTIKVSLAGQSKGVYTATLPAGIVQDKATTPNTSAAKVITFTWNASASTAKPAVLDDADTTNGISNGYTAQVAATPNEIVVTFDKPVSAATALNVNNYLVDGETVFEKAIFVGNESTVRLTLKQDAISVSATRAFTIRNVASSAGVVMDSITFAQPFVENVAPALKSARLLSGSTIEVKFTEALATATLTGGSVVDFEVYVGGVKREAVPVANVGTTAGDTFVITLTNALTVDDLAKDIQVKLLSSTDATDASSINNHAKGDVTIAVAK
ncbi:S-layer homology domain-containing protein [Paenibacillus sp. sgz500958]|uniref:S-layer homology domain-containing protein n=1 Tax=Paenibacillus sp. sgz500958 TaxID=3242475 RepID=UPI0036D429BF